MISGSGREGSPVVLVCPPARPCGSLPCGRGAAPPRGDFWSGAGRQPGFLVCPPARPCGPLPCGRGTAPPAVLLVLSAGAFTRRVILRLGDVLHGRVSPLWGGLVSAVGLLGEDFHAFCRPGSDLLSRVLRRSTIGAGAFHGRVRNGIGCSRSAITTRSAKGMFEKLDLCTGRTIRPRGHSKSSRANDCEDIRTAAGRKADWPSRLMARPVRRPAWREPGERPRGHSDGREAGPAVGADALRSRRARPR